MTPFTYFLHWGFAFFAALGIVVAVTWVLGPAVYCRMRAAAKRRGLLALAIVFALATLSAQTDQVPALRAALAQKTQQLGTCNAELGPLQQLSAEFIAGRVQNVTQTVTGIREAFEKANPGKTVDETWKVIDRPSVSVTPPKLKE